MPIAQDRKRLPRDEAMQKTATTKSSFGLRLSRSYTYTKEGCNLAGTARPLSVSPITAETRARGRLPSQTLADATGVAPSTLRLHRQLLVPRLCTGDAESA